MELTDALEDAFPFARAVTVLVPVEDDGSFVVELVLPVRAGESTLRLGRLPTPAEPDEPGAYVPLPEEVFRHQDSLSWPGARERDSFGRGRWAFLAVWDGIASPEEVRALVSRRVTRHHVLGDPLDEPHVVWASRPGRPGWPRAAAVRSACAAAERLLHALARLSSRPGFDTELLESLVTDVAEETGWALAAHQIHAYAEVCVFTQPQTGLWAEWTLPLQMAGARPSTHKPGEVTRPIPFDTLPPDRRRRSMRYHSEVLRVGGLVDLACTHLPDCHDVDADDPYDWAGLWRVRTGSLGPLVTLLDVASPDERATVEAILTDLGLDGQVSEYRDAQPSR